MSWIAKKIEQVEIDRIKPYERNARTHSQHQIELLAKAIREFGFTTPVLMKSDGTLVAGHGRLEAAKLVGMTVVPAIFVDHLSARQLKALAIADNKIATLAGWDLEALSAELSDLSEMDFDLALTGFDEQELDALLKNDAGILPEGFNEPEKIHVNGYDRTVSTGLTGDDEEIELSPAPVTRRGDIWLLGDHRLRCGDSTNADDVGDLLAGEKPILMVTDQPYGVEYDPNWRNEAYRVDGIKIGGRSIGVVTNDDRAGWADVYALFPGDVAYIWHSGRHGKTVQEDLEACGFKIISQIIWNKSHFAISRGDYHWKHETCWYAVRKGARHNWQGARDQSTVWDIKNMTAMNRQVDSADERTGHSTQKPVECMLRPVLNNSAPGDLVYDPFGGSGSTLIACEKSDRACRMMEISESYCDVIVKRWQKFTGREVIHAETGRTFEQIRNERT